jgi:2-methylisocitrate lyase-like PEP mutase family enzyme
MNMLRAKAELFQRLHRGPKILVLPNAWDAASAVVLAQAGFPAIATTSAGIAFSLGYPDGQRISRDEMLTVVRRIVEHVPLPVTADMEAGYGLRPEEVAETIGRTIAAGAVGANIEDGTGREDEALFEVTLAAARIKAARRAADASGIPFVINARTDGYLVADEATPEILEETVQRANAYREAGADCLFVPGVTDREAIRLLVQRINGPVNVMASTGIPPIEELQALGVARVSTATGLVCAALGVLRRAAQELLGPGTFGYLDGAIRFGEINTRLGQSAIGSA